MSAQTQRTVTLPSPGAIGASRPSADSDPYAARVLTAIAFSSIAAGAINVAAAATVGRSATDTLAFFIAAAAAQVAWGTLALVRAPRWWLALGAAGNLVIAATWLVSRTIGLPVGTYAGTVLPIGFADSLATALEVAVVVGCVALLIRGASLARSATRSPTTTAAIALVVGVLALAGVLAQTGAIGSSSNGNEPGGGGAPSNGGGYGY
jgi:hypothetical protein